MVDKRTEPIVWATLMYELEDAEDGLKSLFKDISADPEFDETDFRIHMTHVYTHLNRAWNARNATSEQQDDETLWEKWGQFPADLNPPSYF